MSLFGGVPVPATRSEHRSTGGYTSMFIAGSMARARGSALGWATGAAESAIGLISRALAGAEVSGTDVLDPVTLAAITRDMLTFGESLHRLDLRADGRLRLARCSGWTVLGSSPDPEEWRYQLTIPAPDQTVIETTTADRMLHTRYASRPESPWKGIGPLQTATTLGSLSSLLEGALLAESKIPVNAIITQPEGATDANIEALLQSLLDPSKQLSLPPTTMAAYGEGRSSAPARDWVPQRLGPDPTPNEVQLQQLVFFEVFCAFGVPPTLADPRAPGASLREAFRQLASTTIRPLAQIISSEASRVLERPVELRHGPLAAGDVVARATAWRRLVGDGDGSPNMDPGEARRLIGW